MGLFDRTTASIKHWWYGYTEFKVRNMIGVIVPLVLAFLGWGFDKFLDVTYDKFAFETVGLANEAGGFDKIIHDDKVYLASIDQTYRLEDGLTLIFYYQKEGELSVKQIDREGQEDSTRLGADLSAVFRFSCPSTSIRLMKPPSSESNDVYFMYNIIDEDDCRKS